MSWRDRSLRRRLLLWLLGPLALVSAVMMIEVHTSASKAANEAYDRVLLGAALAITERVLVRDGQLDVDIPYVALEMLTNAAQDRVFYRVDDGSSGFVTGYDNLPLPPERFLPLGDDPVFYDAVYNGETVRIGVVSRFVTSPGLSTRYRVMVAETVDARGNLIAELTASAALRQLALICIAGVITWFGIGWGLRPLARLQEALNRRSPGDLRPIEHDVPYEVLHLVGAINALMTRLGDSIAAMQRFTSNAAHQLRTPLSAIMTQVELASREDDPKKLNQRLTHVQDGTRQTARLVSQLLTLARAEPNERMGDFLELDFRQLCEAVTRNCVPRALEKSTDLGFEASEGEINVRGMPALLEEMLVNLIDNALTYCPSGSHVTVRVAVREGRVFLEVEDNGPGIPEKEYDRIFERFYRLDRPQAEDGCGLGLAIVREIAARHGGAVRLRGAKGGKGLVVAIELPLAEPV
ncbi:sensor histidine kinase [Aestuariispira insulae]|uniref:histidine kinase n=1 Tax=Aestuariispira insulae TaxID=1461337 RepID=A0A3D9HXK6_9PROT|nr:sensor histidine kinase [Aestuariispira insulae]RED54149.1 two-component system sensor histidine kinase TctE [Aestuariispira insulae]